MVKKFGSEKSSVVKNFGSEKNGSEKFGGEKFGSQIHHTGFYQVMGWLSCGGDKFTVRTAFKVIQCPVFRFQYSIFTGRNRISVSILVTNQ